MTATTKGRSTSFHLGAGSKEELTFRVWTDAKRKGEGRLVCEMRGTYSVFCGHGVEHSFNMNERDIGWYDHSEDLAAARRGDTEAAHRITDMLIEWALEAWDDPCHTS